MKNEMTKGNGDVAQNERFAVRPRVDVFESEAEYLVIADVPGATKDAIDIRFEDGELRLEARRAAAASPGGEGAHVLAEEYKAADYRRAFAMPDGVDPEKIEAELTNGVLKVHLPKSAGRRPRRIDIRAS